MSDVPMVKIGLFLPDDQQRTEDDVIARVVELPPTDMQYLRTIYALCECDLIDIGAYLGDRREWGEAMLGAAVDDEGSYRPQNSWADELMCRGRFLPEQYLAGDPGLHGPAVVVASDYRNGESISIPQSVIDWAREKGWLSG